MENDGAPKMRKRKARGKTSERAPASVPKPSLGNTSLSFEEEDTENDTPMVEISSVGSMRRSMAVKEKEEDLIDMLKPSSSSLYTEEGVEELKRSTFSEKKVSTEFDSGETTIVPDDDEVAKVKELRKQKRDEILVQDDFIALNSKPEDRHLFDDSIGLPILEDDDEELKKSMEIDDDIELPDGVWGSKNINDSITYPLSYEEQFDDLMLKSSILSSSASSASARNAIKSSINSLENEISEMHERIKRNQSDLSEVNDRLSHIGSVSDIERRLNEASNEFDIHSSLRSWFASLVSFVRTLRPDLEKLEDKIFSSYEDECSHKFQFRRFLLRGEMDRRIRSTCLSPSSKFPEENLTFWSSVGCPVLSSLVSDSHSSKSCISNSHQCSKLINDLASMKKFGIDTLDWNECLENASSIAAARSRLCDQVSVLLDDVDEDFSTIGSVASAMLRWKASYPKRFDSVYAQMMIAPLVSIYVRTEVYDWNPLSSISRVLPLIPPMDFVDSILAIDPNSLQKILESIVLPRIADIICFSFDPFSLEHSVILWHSLSHYASKMLEISSNTDAKCWDQISDAIVTKVEKCVGFDNDWVLDLHSFDEEGEESEEGDLLNDAWTAWCMEMRLSMAFLDTSLFWVSKIGKGLIGIEEVQEKNSKCIDRMENIIYRQLIPSIVEKVRKMWKMLDRKRNKTEKTMRTKKILDSFALRLVSILDDDFIVPSYLSIPHASAMTSLRSLQQEGASFEAAIER